jgi:hypothetical protein
MFPLDIDRLKRPAGAVNRQPAPSRKKLPRHRGGEQFLCGPIPCDWLARAARLPGKALAVGVALWFKAGLSKRNAMVRLTGKLMEQFGIGRYAQYRGLKALEAAGLVSVERRRGCAPMVTILDARDSP